MNKYYVTKKGVVNTMYYSQRKSSKSRNHPMPKYTHEELPSWLFSLPLFHKLYEKWVDSGYCRWKKPSLDRIDDSLGYSFKNIRLTSWEDNDKKARDKGILNTNNKKVLQYTKELELINEYFSARDAEEKTGIANQNIAKCCKAKRKTAGGFIWKYKN